MRTHDRDSRNDTRTRRGRVLVRYVARVRRETGTKRRTARRFSDANVSLGSLGSLAAFRARLGFAFGSVRPAKPNGR